ncbi:MAG: transposase [Planctomycetota bacterium]
MARQARFVLEGFPHHITQKGNNAQHVFIDGNDYLKYLQLLEEYSSRYSVKIQAYCLMSNHVHLLVVPGTATSLAETMRSVAARYSKYFNKKYGNKGRLWEVRFHSSVVDTDAYHWWVALYVEWNPVRASLVTRPEQWQYSSARHHALGESDPLVNDTLFDESDMKQYRKLLSEGPPESQVEEIRRGIHANRPVGSGDFLARLKETFGISVTKKRGRPRKIST